MFDYDSSPYNDKFNKEFNKKAVAPIKKDISEGKPIGATHKPTFNPNSNPADREINRRIQKTNRELNPQLKTVSNNPERIEAMKLFGVDEPKIDKQKIDDDINKQNEKDGTFGLFNGNKYRKLYEPGNMQRAIVKDGKLKVMPSAIEDFENKIEIDYDYNLSFEDNLKKLRDIYAQAHPSLQKPWDLRSFYDDQYQGIEDGAEFSDREKMIDMAWEKLQRGNPITINGVRIHPNDIDWESDTAAEQLRDIIEKAGI